MRDACVVVIFSFPSTNAHETNLSYMTLQKFKLEQNLLGDLFKIRNIDKMSFAQKPVYWQCLLKGIRSCRTPVRNNRTNPLFDAWAVE